MMDFLNSLFTKKIMYTAIFKEYWIYFKKNLRDNWNWKRKFLNNPMNDFEGISPLPSYKYSALKSENKVQEQ